MFDEHMIESILTRQLLGYNQMTILSSEFSKMQFKLESLTIIKLNSQFTPKLQKNLYEMWSLHAFEPQFLLSVSCHKPDT